MVKKKGSPRKGPRSPRRSPKKDRGQLEGNSALQTARDIVTQEADDPTLMEGGPVVPQSPGGSKSWRLDTADRYGRYGSASPSHGVPPGVPGDTLIPVPVSYESAAGAMPGEDGMSTIGWRVHVKPLDESVMRALVDANPALQWSPNYMKGVGRDATVLDESIDEQVIKLHFTSPAAVGWFPLTAVTFLGKPDDVGGAPRGLVPTSPPRASPALYQHLVSPQQATAAVPPATQTHLYRSTTASTHPDFVSRPQPAYPPGYSSASPSPPRVRVEPAAGIPAHYDVPMKQPHRFPAVNVSASPSYALLPQPGGGYLPVQVVAPSMMPDADVPAPAEKKYRMQVGDYVVKKVALNGDVGVVIGRDESEAQPILVRWMDRDTKVTRRTDVHGDGELRKIDDFKLTEDLYSKTPVEEQVDVIFRYYDTNADGHWNLEELNRCLNDADLQPLTHEQFRAACREIGCNPAVGLLKADVRMFVFHGSVESIQAVYHTIRRHIREARAQQESPLATLSIDRGRAGAHNDAERGYWSSPSVWGGKKPADPAPAPRIRQSALTYAPTRLAGSPYTSGHRSVKL